MSRLLVVDDDGFTRQLLSDTVRALGHQAAAAGDAREALRLLTSEHFDAVIADVRMPGCDGIELARRVALLPKAPPVALTSAEVDFEVHEEALRRGVKPASFLHKPFDRGSVGRIIRALTGGASSLPPVPTEPRRETSSVPILRDDHPDWLTRVRGTTSQLSPTLMWFVAWRRQATGAIVVRRATPTRLGVRRGRVVDVTGLPRLLGAHSPAESLCAAMNEVLGQGGDPEAALGRIAGNIAAWALAPGEGEVAWESDWSPTGPAMPLPGTPPALVAHAIAEQPAESITARWAPMLPARLTRRTPADVPADQLGLDAPALRAHRLASGQTAQALVYELTEGSAARRLGALRTLDLLLRLNLVSRQD